MAASTQHAVELKHPQTTSCIGVAELTNYEIDSIQTKTIRRNSNELLLSLSL